MSNVKDLLISWFGSPEKEGFFARLFPSYEYRKQQLEMALEVAEALDNQEHLIVEAGTGVGKTLAYLAPIVASGKKAVISTATKTLQDQLVRKDIPLLLNSVATNHFRDKNSVCLLKGRLNYLCKRKLGRFEEEILKGRLVHLFGIYENYKAFGQFMKVFKNWIKGTSTGEISELVAELANKRLVSFSPDTLNIEERLGHVLGASTDQCPGPRCAFFNSCFVINARKRASSAKLVVVNHYLLCTDLMGKVSESFEIVPSADVLVIDEAHHFADAISHAFTVSYYSSYLEKLAEELGFATGRKEKVWEEYTRIEKNISDHHKALLDLLDKSVTIRPSSDLSGMLAKDRRASLQQVFQDEKDICSFQNIVKAIAESYRVIRLLLDEGSEEHLSPIAMTDECHRVLNQIATSSSLDSFIWFEIGDQNFAIHLTPLNAVTYATEPLFESYSSIIFTSATIAVANSNGDHNFDFFREHVGVDPSTRSLAIGSPYSYEEQMICFIPPDHFPMPDEPDFIDAVLQYAVPIIKAFPGGTLFLCTSYRNMKVIADNLRRELPDRRILVQGESSRSHILEEFRADTGSILVATGTFWEGIDVPGESLQALLIDKLPFPSPSDPLVEGRCQYIAKSGRDPFLDYYMPRMILALRQGIGRLIRSSRDRGVVGIFDVRIRRKGYGRKILANLPPCRIIESFDDLTNFVLT